MFVAFAVVAGLLFLSIKITRKSPKRKIGTDQVEGGNEKKLLEIRFQGRFYDVTDFVKKHPGGAIIKFYINNEEDATEAIQQFHHRSAKKVEQILKSFKSRPISEEQVPKQMDLKYEELTEDFKKLYHEFEAEGLFEPDPLYVAMRILEIILLGALGLVVIALSSQSTVGIWTGALIVGIVMMRAAYLMHEFGHLSMTGSPKWDRLLEEIIMGLVIGMSGTWWRSQHNRHHAMPQRLKHDVDLKTEPLMAFNVAILDNKSNVNFFIRHQAKLFIPIVSVVAVLRWKLHLCPKLAFLKKEYHELALMFLHYTIAYYYIGAGPYFFAMTFLANSMFLTFALSHSHYLPVTNEPRHWVEYSLVHSMDIDSSWLLDWWTGYLNYQIEHHLFPTMPHFRHAKIWRRVRDLAMKHNLPYLKTSYGTAVKTVFINLSSVSKELQGGN